MMKMNIVVFILFLFSSWAFADDIEDQVDDLQAYMKKALDVQSRDDEDIKKKMKEISKSVSDEDLSHLTTSITVPPEGMSEEEFRKMGDFVKKTLQENKVKKEDIDQLKREISKLTQ